MTYAFRAPARYVQGKGELDNLGRHIKKIGSRFLLIGSENCWTRFGQRIRQVLSEQDKQLVFQAFQGEATLEEVRIQAERCQAECCDGVIGMGGGKALDTAKAVAEQLGLPCVIVPTAASNDAPCSGVAVLYNEQGVVVKALLTRRNPDLVLVDTEIIANAPVRLFVAGLGDALATYFEARACHKSGARTLARGNVSNTALAISRLCCDLLLRDGQAALEAVKRHVVTQELDNVVEASIFLSGTGFENGGLAAAHAVNDGLAQEPQTHGMLHGEKVAFGLLTQLVLENGPQAERDQIMAFMKAVGLPTTFAQLGIRQVDKDNLFKVAQAACVPTQSTKNLRGDITPEEVCQAMWKADEWGRSC